MIKKIVFILVVFFVGIWGVNAYTQVELRLLYDRFYTQVSQKYSHNESKIIPILEQLDKKIQLVFTKTSHKKNKESLNVLRFLNQDKIIALQNKKTILNEEEILDTSPKIHPNYINNLLKNGYNYINVSSNLELRENNVTYKLNVKKYYELTLNNHAYFVKNHLKGGIILFFQDKYILTNDVTKEKKFTYKDLENNFTHFFHIQNPYILEWGVYYSYRFTQYIFFDSIDSFYESDFIANKIDFKNTLFVKDGNKYFFTNTYEKVRLTSEKNILNITNKNEFLYNISDDSKFFPANYDEILSEIKTTTLTLVSSAKNDQEKINRIYDFVVDKITYYENYVRDGNKQVFSWILTYKNKTGVCDGYTKLFLYMLSFAWIQDVQVMRGFAYDNTDFPNYWHAWVRIWEKYYDPTFDDPIWGTRVGNYYYFGIPRELMYVNRFDGMNIPENLKKLSLQERKNIVMKNMYEIYLNYRNFTLMNTIRNRKYLQIDFDEKINLALVVEKMWAEEVQSGEFYHEWYKFVIRSLNYYLLTENNVESIISSPKIDLENMYLLKWYRSDWWFDYRLAYDVIFE